MQQLTLTLMENKDIYKYNVMASNENKNIGTSGK